MTARRLLAGLVLLLALPAFSQPVEKVIFTPWTDLRGLKKGFA